jgi:hypothetical protein
MVDRAGIMNAGFTWHVLHTAGEWQKVKHDPMTWAGQGCHNSKPEPLIYLKIRIFIDINQIVTIEIVYLFFAIWMLASSKWIIHAKWGVLCLDPAAR